MASTPAPYLKNLTAKENEASNFIAKTPTKAVTAYAAFTGFTGASTYTSATAGTNPTVTTPSFPTTTTPVTNTNSTGVLVNLTGGTVTGVSINGVSAGTADGLYFLPAGATIAITYTGSPAWTWSDAGGLPGAPAGYILTVINGNLCKIPYFNF